MEASVVGTGPNGLSAAITLALAGVSVTAYEAHETPGGGARSAALTLPGYLHDVCSAVHPMACGSPFFRTLPLARHGLEWIHPDAPLAHPLDDGGAVILERSVELTGSALGADGPRYRWLMKPLVQRWDELGPMVLGPALRLPAHPILLARFGVPALLPARRLAEIMFKGGRARALFSGIAAHAALSLDSFLSAAPGLVLGVLAHAAGWPVASGGSQKIADALTAHLVSLGGKVITGNRVERLSDLPAARATLLDITPRQLLGMAEGQLHSRYREQLQRYRYGPGVFKLDYALDAPVPWKDKACLRAATLHLGGTMEEIAASEETVSRGGIPESPFVLVSQPSLFDSSRAPEGKHVLWAYCHVPNGSSADMTERIERQIERFAPGFRSRILARHVLDPEKLNSYNSNCIGGDINGGVLDIRQFITRPTRRLNPYSTPVRGLYLCSASTPPGGGVHGMCGHLAAIAALRTDL